MCRSMQLVISTVPYSLDLRQHRLVPFGVPMEQQGLHKYATVQCSFSTMLCCVSYVHACVTQHKHRTVPPCTVQYRTVLHKCSEARNHYSWSCAKKHNVPFCARPQLRDGADWYKRRSPLVHAPPTPGTLWPAPNLWCTSSSPNCL